MRPSAALLLLVGASSPALLAQPVGDQAGTAGVVAEVKPASSIDPERLFWHIPDPEAARERARQGLDAARQADDTAAVNRFTRSMERIQSIQRPDPLRLTLEDVVRRTLEHNFTIQTVSYSPAIETARVVEAQAAFDAVFFANLTKNNVDRPTGSQLLSTDADFLTIDAGVRKLLSTGTIVRAQYGLRRTKQAFVFQTINPEYFSTIILEMRQPLLRGFGVEFNRSLIVVAKNDRRIGDLTFRRQIRDTLRQVEELYWRLVQTRRDVVITARELADFEGIYEYVVSRRDFDMTPVQIESTKADLEFAHADFIRRVANARNAQDRLVAAMNDPAINLADVIEIIPQDSPNMERLRVDRLGELQAALDNRTEIKEQELRIANAKIGIVRAENAELPRFDLTFRTTYDGLGENADQSFDEVTRSRFIEYFVGLEFEVPVGNRGPKAARRRAGLIHDQAAAQLRSVIEGIILDVNLAVRELEASHDQITPAFESAEARERQVESIVARAERKDINTLQTELNARRSLAGTRRGLVGAMVQYNIAIVDLERAKGTLLKYNNVFISTEGEATRQPWPN